MFTLSELSRDVKDWINSEVVVVVSYISLTSS